MNLSLPTESKIECLKLVKFTDLKLGLLNREFRRTSNSPVYFFLLGPGYCVDHELAQKLLYVGA